MVLSSLCKLTITTPTFLTQTLLNHTSIWTPLITNLAKKPPQTLTGSSVWTAAHLQQSMPSEWLKSRWKGSWMTSALHAKLPWMLESKATGEQGIHPSQSMALVDPSYQSLGYWLPGTGYPRTTCNLVSEEISLAVQQGTHTLSTLRNHLVAITNQDASSDPESFQENLSCLTEQYFSVLIRARVFNTPSWWCIMSTLRHYLTWISKKTFLTLQGQVLDTTHTPPIFLES